MKFTIISDLVLTRIPVKMADHHLPSSSIILPHTIVTDALFAEPQMFKTYGNISKAMKVIDDLPDGVLDSIPEVVSEAKRIIDQVDKDTVSNAVDMLKWFKYLRHLFDRFMNSAPIRAVKFMFDGLVNTVKQFLDACELNPSQLGFAIAFIVVPVYLSSNGVSNTSRWVGLLALVFFYVMSERFEEGQIKSCANVMYKKFLAIVESIVFDSCLLFSNLFKVAISAIGYDSGVAPKKDEATPQSALNVDVCRGLASTVWLILTGVRMPTGHQWSAALMSHIQSYPNTVKGIEEYSRFFSSLIQETYNNLVLPVVGGAPLVSTWMRSKECADVLRKCLVLEQSFYNKSLPENHETKSYLQSLMDSCVELRATVVESKKTSANVVTAQEAIDIDRCMSILKTVSSHIYAVVPNTPSTRQEPVGILLHSEPGVGKSILCDYLVRDLTSAVLDESSYEDFLLHPNNYVHYRKNDKHFDGFHSNTVCLVYDDFLQEREVAGGVGNASAEIIANVNVSAHKLTMAKLESKANSYANNTFTIMTTNLDDPEKFAHGINCADALKRRMHYKIKPFVSAKYAKNGVQVGVKFDVDKLPVDETTGSTYLPQDLWHFQVSEIGDDHKSSTMHDYEGLVSLLLEGWETRRKQLKASIAASMNRVKTFRDKYRYLRGESPEPSSELEFEAIPQSRVLISPYNLPVTFTKRIGLLTSKYYSDKKLDSLLSEAHVMNLLTSVKGNDRQFFADDMSVRSLESALASYYVIVKDGVNVPFNVALRDQLITAVKSLTRCTRLTMSTAAHVAKYKMFTNARVAISDGRAVDFYTALYLIAIRSLNDAIEFVQAMERFVLSSNNEEAQALNEELEKAEEKSQTLSSSIVAARLFGKFIELLPTISAIVTSVVFLLKVIPDTWSKTIFVPEGGDYRKDARHVDQEFVDQFIDPQSQYVDKSNKGNRAELFVRSRARNYRPTPAPRFREPNADPQMYQQKSSPKHDVLNLIRKNLYTLFLCEDQHATTGIFVGSVLFVKNAICTFNAHFIPQMDKYLEDHQGAVVRLFSSNSYPHVDMVKGISIACVPLDDLLNCVSCDIAKQLDSDGMAGKDVYLVDMRPILLQWPFSRDITKHFARRSEVSGRVFDTTLIAGKDFVSYHSSQSRFPDYICPMRDVGDLLPHTIIEYNASTSHGDCGGVLVASLGTSNRHKICGIHMAYVASKERALAQFVGIDDIINALTKLEMTTPDDVYRREYPELQSGNEETAMEFGDMSPLILDEESNKYPEDFHTEDDHVPNWLLNFRYVGKVDGVQDLGSSSYRRTNVKLPGYACNKRPPHLRPFTCPVTGNIIDPFEICVSKYATVHMAVRIDVIMRCVSEVFNMFNQNSVVPAERRLFTYEEAVEGSQHIPDWGPIDRTTSAGFPYILDLKAIKPYKGRQHILGADGPFRYDTEEAKQLRCDVEHIIAKSRDGIRLFHVFIDRLKDALIPKEKVDKGKGRLFSSCPLPLLVATRMYFGAFCNWLNRNSVSNGCVLSINPYGRMWDRIAAALRTKLSNYSDPGVSAGDFSGFDSSELPVIHTVILQHINDWYGKPASHPDSIARCVLFMELVNSRHLCRDVLYEWSGSLPSGHPLTSVVNNIYNHISVRYAWWRMCEEAMQFDKFLDASDYHEQIFASFDENVAYITCGDDNIFSVKENMRDRFCLPVIAQYMSEIGLTLTSETKSSELKYDFRTIKETRFLKRSFYWDTVNLKWLAPLDLASFLDSVYWYKKSNYVTEKDSIFMNVNTALMELSQWTPEMYNRWAPHLISVCEQSTGRSPRFLTRGHWLRFVLDYDDPWIVLNHI